MPFPPIFRDLFGRRLPGEAGDARSEISEADGMYLIEYTVLNCRWPRYVPLKLPLKP